MSFDYSNLSARPPGTAVRVLSRVLRGVRDVQAQVGPYAEQWRVANLAALERSGPLWVALGDSMTQGIGASAYDRGWTGQLGAVAGLPTRLVNLSSSGARVSDVLERQLPALESLGATPDLVTLLIGSNDLIRRKRREEFPGSFAALLERLPPGSVVATLPNPSRAAAAGNDALVRAVAERGLRIADLRDRRTSSWKGKLAADHFHPNDAGYAGIAAVFADAITSALHP